MYIRMEVEFVGFVFLFFFLVQVKCNSFSMKSKSFAVFQLRQ